MWQRHSLWWGGSSDGGATAEVVLGAPPLAGSRWGQIFGESVAMGTGRFGKGELKGGAEDAKSEPHPQAAVTMTTSTVLGRGRRGGVTNERVGTGWGRQFWGAERGGESQSTSCYSENRVSQGAGRPQRRPQTHFCPSCVSVLSEDIPVRLLSFLYLLLSSLSHLFWAWAWVCPWDPLCSVSVSACVLCAPCFSL